MFDDLRQAVKNIEFLADPTVGEIRVGTHDPIMVGLLPAVFDRLHQKHPGISIHVLPKSPERAADRDLRERKLDLFLGRFTPPIEEDIRAEILFYDRIHVVAGPTNRWARRRNVKVSELANEAWCLPLPDTLVGSLVADALTCARNEISAKGRSLGNALLCVCAFPERALFGHLSGLAVAVRCQSCAAEGPASGPADCALAGGNHDVEKSHAHPRRETFHRLRARGHEAFGR